MFTVKITEKCNECLYLHACFSVLRFTRQCLLSPRAHRASPLLSFMIHYVLGGGWDAPVRGMLQSALVFSSSDQLTSIRLPNLSRTARVIHTKQRLILLWYSMGAETVRILENYKYAHPYTHARTQALLYQYIKKSSFCHN